MMEHTQISQTGLKGANKEQHKHGRGFLNDKNISIVMVIFVTLGYVFAFAFQYAVRYLMTLVLFLHIRNPFC